MFSPLQRALRSPLDPARRVASGGGPVPQPPVVVTAPEVSGNAEVGSTLSATTGSWAGDEPITYAYHWREDGADVLGATASTFVTTRPADVDCRVTATNAAGSSSALSNTLAVVEPEPANEPQAPALGRLQTSVGGTWPSSGGRAIASRSTLAEAADTIAYWQHFGNGGDAGNTTAGRSWVGLVYADDGGEPGELLHASAIGTTVAEGGWHQAALAVSLPAGDYWLATLVSDFGVTINSATPANGGAVGNIRRGEGLGSPASPADPWPGSASTNDGTLTACVTYIPGG